MDPFVDQLGSLCRGHVTRSKWVFVPSHAVGRTVGERIALEGTNWLNLRFVTPLDVALRMGAPFLVERGIDPSEEGLGPALVMRLLLEIRTSSEAPQAGPGSEQPHFVLEQKHLSRESAPRKAGPPRSEPPATGASGAYFQHLADQPTMAQALWTTIRELRMAGVKAADLSAEAFESPAKHAEELHTNLLVEAGAGSGKTQMLAERMAAGIATGAYQIEHIAAVTFTRKAASELRGRFHLALEENLRDLPDPQMKCDR